MKLPHPKQSESFSPLMLCFILNRCAAGTIGLCKVYTHTYTHSAYITRTDTHMLTCILYQRLCTVINALWHALQIESNQVKCCEGPREKEQVCRWLLTIKSVTFGNKARSVPLSCNCVWQMLQSRINVSSAVWVGRLSVQGGACWFICGTSAAQGVCTRVCLCVMVEWF